MADMSEIKQLIAPFLVVILIETGGYFAANYIQFSGDLVVDRYEATIFPDGSLKETYVYDVGTPASYSMLFRVWKVPLLNPDESDLDRPYVKASAISCPDGGTPYVKNHAGVVWARDDSAKNQVRARAYENEAGCYLPGMYGKDKHTLAFDFMLYPPVECDEVLCHMNLMLAWEHVPYKDIEIILKEPGIRRVFPHPPDFRISERDGGWVINGKSPANQLIEIEMLMEPVTSGKFLRKLNNIEEKTVLSNEPYSNKYFALTVLKYVLIAAILGFPLILIFVYLRYGREKEYTVPQYLSFIPGKRKPWFVNQVFKSDAFDFDENGFYATLLDLHRRAFLKIEPRTGDGKDVRIKLLRKPEEADDIYEKVVMSFLWDWSIDGVFDTADFKDKVKSMRNKGIEELKTRMDKLTKFGNPALAEDFAVRGGGKFGILFLASALLTAVLYLYRSGTYPILTENAVYSATLAVQSLFIALFTPSTLFGRWKGEYYKENWNGTHSAISFLIWQ